MNFKKFFKDKGVGYYLMAAALVCAIVALILYLQTGVSEFSPTLDGAITAAYSVFIVLAALMLIYEVRIIKYAASAVGLYAFLMYIIFQINYIANLLTAIDPTEVTAGFVLTIIFGLLAWGLALASSIMTKTGIKALESKERKEESV